MPEVPGYNPHEVDHELEARGLEKRPCTPCKGRGTVGINQGKKICPDCRGEGYVWRLPRLERKEQEVLKKYEMEPGE